MAITPKNALDRKGKVAVFWKIWHKCCKIGSKMVKIDGEMAENNEIEVCTTPLIMGQIQCIKF